MILFIKHIGIEGPGTLGDFFKAKNLVTETVELQKKGTLPADIGGIEAVISLGGPMSVYEENRHPFLKDEDAFLKKVIKNNVPFIGICLGSQLLAKACGAKIKKSPEKEIGFFPVQMTEDGAMDPLFEGIDGVFNAFQWHEDMSEVPAGAKLLAYSQGCPHQAFKVGPVAYGLQFHVEVTAPTIESWADAYFAIGDSFRMQQKRLMIEDYALKEKNFHQNADKIYNNFLKMVRQRKGK